MDGNKLIPENLVAVHQLREICLYKRGPRPITVERLDCPIGRYPRQTL